MLEPGDLRDLAFAAIGGWQVYAKDTSEGLKTTAAIADVSMRGKYA
jgi:hypothetical protein